MKTKIGCITIVFFIFSIILVILLISNVFGLAIHANSNCTVGQYIILAGLISIPVNVIGAVLSLILSYRIIKKKSFNALFVLIILACFCYNIWSSNYYYKATRPDYVCPSEYLQVKN